MEGAIALYLVNGSILDIITGGGGGDPPAPVDVTALNINLKKQNII